MCFFGSKPRIDNTPAIQAQQEAEQAREREDTRAADIARGQASIAENFSQFDEPFYDTRRTAYVDYATPQLNEQFGDAEETTNYNLARQGLLRSQEAIDQIARLNERFAFQKANILADADSHAQEQRADVENNRQKLLNQLDASADPDAAANNALTQSNFLRTSKPEFSPLGSMFGDMMSVASNYREGQRDADARKIAEQYTVPAPGLPGSKGSGKNYK